MSFKQHGNTTQMSSQVTAGPDVCQTPSDLLIPAGLMPRALRLKSRRGQWRDVIAYLIQRHREAILRLAGEKRNLRFQYQVDGLDLQRVCYVPYKESLAELRLLSFASRISMCALVVLMLTWEWADRGENPVVPISFAAEWELTCHVLTVASVVRKPKTRPP